MSSCGICNEPASDHQHIECEFCDASYHLKCVGYTHSDYKIWSVRDNIFYMCDECKEDKTTQQYKEIKKVLSIIQQYAHKIDECVQNQSCLINTIGRGVTLYNDNCGKLMNAAKDNHDSVINASERIGKRVEKIEEAMGRMAGQPHENSGLSYADVVKSTGKAKPVCVIRPKSSEQQLESTRNEIKSVVDPTKIGVSGLRGAGGGSVAVVCDDEVALEKVKEIVERNLSERYDVAAAKVMHPRIKLSGLSEEKAPDELLDLLVAQNNLSVDREEIRIVMSRTTKNGRYFEVVLEVPPRMYNDMLARGSVKLGWDICRIMDGIVVRRCATCCGYSHLKEKCPFKEKVCIRCAGRHEVKNCKATRICCANCKRVSEKEGRRIPLDHCANDKGCPTYRRALRRLRDRISFN